MALVQAIKFGNQRRLIPFVAALIAKAIPQEWQGFTIVPVPSRRSAVRNRGYDLTECIARGVSCRLAVPSCELLVRHGTQQQKALSFVARSENVAGSFSPRIARSRIGSARFPCARSAPELVVLVDDVFTTGATVSECSKIIKALGTRKVWCITIAMEQ